MRTYKLKNNPSKIEYCYEHSADHTEVYIDFLYTPNEHRKYGYATELMNRFIKTMSKYDTITLYSATYFGSELDKLIKFYEKFGFKVSGNKAELYAYMTLDCKEIREKGLV